MTHDLWTNLNATIFNYLSQVSLASLVEKQRAQDTSVLQDQREVHSGLRPHATPASGTL
jgi:Rrf2 family iron-sulfur cluster assembly transcriptional regulator